MNNFCEVKGLDENISCDPNKDNSIDTFILNTNADPFIPHYWIQDWLRSIHYLRFDNNLIWSMYEELYTELDKGRKLGSKR